MLRAVIAQDFLKRMGTGKTKPCLLGCVEMLPVAPLEKDENGPKKPEEVELVVKFADGPERKKNGLIAEVLAAAFAADLDLPVPEPFLVRVEKDFAAAIPDSEIRQLAERSLGWAFGSRKLPPQYSTILSGVSLHQSLLSTAAEILAFDVMISNADRRPANPNCLSNSQELALYDHELAFVTEGIIGWKPPWERGGADKAILKQHLFFPFVKGRKVNLDRLRGALEAITPGRIEEYRASLPAEWDRESGAAERILVHIRKLRDHAAAVIKQIPPLLK